MTTFKTFLILVTIVASTWFITNELQTLHSQADTQSIRLVQLQNELISLRLADKARIESDIANLAIDSIAFIRNAWISDDPIERKMLVRQARLIMDKKQNLQQALMFVPDSTVFAAIEVVEVEPESIKPQISFKSNK